MFSLLGPLEIRARDITMNVKSARQRTVLAILLLSAGQVVSVDSLIQAVWSGAGPVTARNQIAICIAALRKALRDLAGEEEVIATRHPGYVLRVGVHRIDVTAFRELTQAAQEATRSGHTTEATELMARALGLWRGRALDGVAGARIEEEAARLEELRLNMHEERVGLQLTLGHHRKLIGELTLMVQQHPLREQARAHLMLALYRLGRRADALETFRVGRQLLIDELGIEPGPTLQGLHNQLLHDSPELGLQPNCAVPVPPPAAPGPNQLPADAAAFTGRASELAVLETMLKDADEAVPLAVAALHGVAGVGKTALTVHWANQAAARFPDGQLFIDLRGYDTLHEPLAPAAALDRFLRALGIPAAQIPADLGDRSTLYRSLLDSKKVLIVLDNAQTFEQIKPLLPGRGHCCVLVTSRNLIDQLVGDYAVVRIGLNVLEPDEAVALLESVAGPERFTAEPDATARLIALCDRLPLALRISGARLVAKPHWSVQALVGRLEDERRRLDELSPNEGGVRAGFDLSYRGLPPLAAKMYRRLGLLNAPDFAAWIGAAVLDTDVGEAEDLMEQLVDAQLLEVISGGRGRTTRYRFQDLLRLYAWECAQREETDEQSADALDRAFSGWLALADEAYRRLDGGQHAISEGSVPRLKLPSDLMDELLADPLAWFESEHSAIVGAVAQAAARDRSAYAWALTVSSTTLFETRDYLDDWGACVERALAASERSADRLGMATMMRSRSSLAIHQRRYDEAEALLPSVLRLFEEIGDVRGQALTRRNQAMCAHFRGDLDAALLLCSQALSGLQQVADISNESHLLGLLSQTVLKQGDVTGAIKLSGEAISMSRRAGCPRAEIQNTYWLAEALLQNGELARAEHECGKVLAFTRADGDRIGELHALCGLGYAQWRQGLVEEAGFTLTKALALAEHGTDRFLLARVELNLGCTMAMIDRPAAIDWLTRARRGFRALGSGVWLDRTERLLEAVGQREAGTPISAEYLVRLLES